MKYVPSSSRARLSALSLAAFTVFAASALTLTTASGQISGASGIEMGFMLQARTTGLCVDNAGSAKTGTALQGWKCSTRNLNQRFTQVRRGKKFTALRNKLSGLCLDAGKDSAKPGAPVFQARCADRPEQSLEVRPIAVTGNRSDNSKDVHLRIHQTGLCLQLTGDAKRGGRLVQERCDNKNANQEFSFTR